MRAACCARRPAAIRWCSSPKAPSRPKWASGKFHTGAFAIAARAACPVVPAVILGTRRNMPATRILPRPGPIEVRYGAPIVPPPAAADEDPALQLRDASRAAILAQLGEPDLCVTAQPTGS